MRLMPVWRFTCRNRTIFASSMQPAGAGKRSTRSVPARSVAARAAAKGIDAKKSLARNDGHGFFEALGDQVVTGPTLTNVNDFRAILVTG